MWLWYRRTTEHSVEGRSSCASRKQPQSFRSSVEASSLGVFTGSGWRRRRDKRRKEEKRRKKGADWLTSVSCLCCNRCLKFQAILEQVILKTFAILLKDTYSYHGSFIFTDIFFVTLFLAAFSRWQMISVSWAIAVAKECDELMLSLIDWLFFFTHF